MFASTVKSILMTADTVGGVWTYALDLARGLEPHGVEVILVTMGAKPDRHQRRQAAELDHVTLRTTPYQLEWMEDPWRDVERAGEMLLRLEERYAPDVIHLNGYCHGALDFRAPVLVVGHSCVYSWHHAVRGTLPGREWLRYRRLVSQGIQGADLVTAPTQAMIRCLRRFYGNFRHAEPIYNGRDFMPLPVRKELFVFSAGRLWDEAKNMQSLQQAAGRIRWPIRIAGQNRHPNGHSVHFPGLEALGLLNAGQMRDLFSRASIFALPVRYEPFGLCVLEAALCGCGLVLGDLESLREVWQDAAVYVDPDDPEAIADEVNRLIDHPARLREAGRKARERARRYSLRQMAEGYMKLYRYLKSGETGGLNRQSLAAFS